MTASGNGADAPPDGAEAWQSIDWQNAEATVGRLQVRIAKAAREGKWRKVRSLQWLLTHSWSAKVWAVKRVTTNRGRKTPGVDGVIWTTPQEKWQAAQRLRRRGYRALPLRRVYIPKKKKKCGKKAASNHAKRALHIPTMRDRAMQALWKLALDPVAETLADPNSYGFRRYRKAADAIQQCFIALGRRYCAVWVLEADIRACFDRILHRWLLANICMDRRVLKKWLEAGYIENKKLYPTTAGTPQGGIVSPVLANLTLDGLEEVVRRAVPRRIRGIRCKVHVIRFADDFIITAESYEILVELVLPAVRAFLAERGLELNEEKSRITKIEDGVDFLGQNLRKRNGKLLIRPSKEAVCSIRGTLRETLRRSRGAKAGDMIKALNSQIRGWANYHRHVASGDTFKALDNWLYHCLWRWVKRRHPKKSAKWLHKKYWSLGENGWFGVLERIKKKKLYRLHRLVRFTGIPIVRHIKVRGAATPYDPAYEEYFAGRKAGKKYYPARGNQAEGKTILRGKRPTSTSVAQPGLSRRESFASA